MLSAQFNTITSSRKSTCNNVKLLGEKGGPVHKGPSDCTSGTTPSTHSCKQCPICHHLVQVQVQMQVTGLLDLRDLQAARSVCRQWHVGISMGVTKLQPRMEANAVGLQWTELHKLQVRIISGCILAELVLGLYVPSSSWVSLSGFWRHSLADPASSRKCWCALFVFK